MLKRLVEEEHQEKMMLESSLILGFHNPGLCNPGGLEVEDERLRSLEEAEEESTK